MVLSQNSEYTRIFQVTGANQKARKLLSTDLVNTKEALKNIYSSARLVLSQSVCLLNASIDSVSGIIFL